MRKFIFLAVLLNTVFLAQGQGNGPDTIVGRNPNYFYDFWPLDEWAPWTTDTSFIYRVFNHELPHRSPNEDDKCSPDSLILKDRDYVFEKKLTSVPIKVIGLAWVYSKWEDPNDDWTEGGSGQRHYEFRFEDSVFLCEVDDTGRLVYIEGTRISYGDTVAHRLFGICDRHNCPASSQYHQDRIPDSVYWDVYEYYFQAPVVVRDSFYIGMTDRNSTDDYRRLRGYQQEWGWPRGTSYWLWPVDGMPMTPLCPKWDLRTFIFR